MTQSQLKVLAAKSFDTPLLEHGSWGSRQIGTYSSTMELMKYDSDDDTSAFIEWDIPAIESTEHIGLTFELIDGRRHLIDFDGVMDIPLQAIELLEEQGIVVGDEFKE